MARVEKTTVDMSSFRKAKVPPIAAHLVASLVLRGPLPAWMTSSPVPQADERRQERR
jgi:hypothetical protein